MGVAGYGEPPIVQAFADLRVGDLHECPVLGLRGSIFGFGYLKRVCCGDG